jgi:hypothetical protein
MRTDQEKQPKGVRSQARSFGEVEREAGFARFYENAGIKRPGPTVEVKIESERIEHIVD